MEFEDGEPTPRVEMRSLGGVRCEPGTVLTSVTSAAHRQSTVQSRPAVLEDSDVERGKPEAMAGLEVESSQRCFL